jgi:hypothetical protein
MQWHEALIQETDRKFYGAEAKDPAVHDWNRVTELAIEDLWAL